MKHKPSFLQRWRTPLIAAIVAGGLLVGYKMVAQDPSESPGVQVTSSDRSIVTLSGTTVSFPQAGTASAVYFFATTCSTCLPQLRDLAASAAKHPEVMYVPVSVYPDDNAEKVRWFLSAAGDDGRAAALDPQARLAVALQATTLGTLIIFDRAGSAVYRGVEPSADEIAKAFAQATR